MYWVEIRKKKALYDGSMLTYDKYKDEGIVTGLGDFGNVRDARRSAIHFLKKHKMYYGGQSGYSYDTTIYRGRQPVGTITLISDSHATWKGVDSGKMFRILSDGTLTGY